MLPILLVLLLHFQASGVPSHAAPPLELSAGLNTAGSRLKVTWANHGPAPFLLNVGMIGGAGLIPRLRLSIQGTGITPGQLIDTSHGGAAAGRMEFLVVCLAPHTEYAVDFATDQLWLPGYKNTLKTIQNRPWTLTVSFQGLSADHLLPNGKPIPYDVIRNYPADFPFWLGTLQTEVVNAPKP